MEGVDRVWDRHAKLGRRPGRAGRGSFGRGWLGVGGELGEVLCRLRTVVVVYLEGKRRKVEAFQPMLGGLGR